MIKRYKDFDSTDYLSKERESMERELRARKTKRNNIKYDLEINLDLIIREIMYAISNDEEYVLSIGKRTEDLENSKDSIFHIEFENERLGRVRIFKPKDTADKGHYEVNGDYYETLAKNVRDLYHILNQEIQGEEMIVRTAVTESLTDKMVGKSKTELEEAFENYLDRLVLYAIDVEPDIYDDYMETYDKFYKHEEKIKKLIEDGNTVQDAFHTLFYGSID